MGLLDQLGGGGAAQKEIAEAKRDLANVKEQLRKTGFERDDAQKKNLHLIDKTHSFLQRLRLLASTLEDEHVVPRAWELLDMTLAIKKGGIFDRTPDGWKACFSLGWPENKPPVIPCDEDSMAMYCAEHGVPLSIAHLRKQDDLAYLERRGIIPDTKIVCPIRVRGEVSKLLIICSYGGNVFSSEDDVDTLEIVTTLLGLVQTNTLILQDQKKELFEKSLALSRLRNIFHHLVAPEVIEYLEKNPEGVVLGGKRQPVVVMFADIRGFTQISENLPPESVIDLLNRYFTRLTDIILNHKGTLDKFMGDAAMVLFGTPMPIDSPVEKAVAAAQEIQDMVEDSMADWVKSGLPPFSVGIGINYQEVVVGNVGSQKLSNFTVIGDGVNLAFRLCSVAQGGEILVSESVYEALQDWDGKAEARPKIQLKGKAEPITVYSLSRYANYRAGQCPKCATSIQEGVRFCGSCGYRRF